MKYILGTKKYMTQIFTEDGRVVPGTVVSVWPGVVTQIKTIETDGYSAVQVGFGSQVWSRINKAQKGHMQKATDSSGHGFRQLKEFRLPESATKDLKVGQEVEVSGFAEGDTVSVSGVTKGKGFQGVVKRHNFAGGPRSHGQKHSEREPGSIGAMGVQRVLKGTRMAGRMGGDSVKVKNLKIAKLDLDKGEMLVTGAIPGRPGSLVAIEGK